MSAARTLAEFAVDLEYENIPPAVLERAKDCLIDTVGACVFGTQLSWSRMVIDYARRNSAPGGCSILGTPHRVRAPFACLANGAAAHAFELDCLVEPAVGIHPSAALAVPALAPATARGLDGRTLLTAIVAGYEVLYRIGDAARQSMDKAGFHSPGIVGVFGTVAVIGRLFGLDAGRMAHAFGIAGSMCGGLMEFSRTGGMVKRLHLGRSAESGFMAAMLARDGYTGPDGVFEGRYGILNTYCRNADPARLTRDLGSTWHTLKNRIKAFASHSTSQVPLGLTLDLRERYRISGEDVAGIVIAANEKVVAHHAIHEPRDVTMMQYSTPFGVALALCRDPGDPRVYSDESLADPGIMALSRNARVELLAGAEGRHPQTCRVTLHLRDGREVAAEGHDCKGSPTMPFTRDELRGKFLKLTAHCDRERAAGLFAHLAQAERVSDFGKLDFALA